MMSFATPLSRHRADAPVSNPESFANEFGESMKYICLVYHEEKKLDALSQGELDALVAECDDWVKELAQNGQHVFSAGLQSIRTATTVRSQNDKLTLTDGPFAETKEFLGGFTIINARDLNEAIQLASKLPAMRVGTIEVRPVLDSDAELTDPLDRKIGAAIRRRPHPETFLAAAKPRIE
jgi:hypothetical protein